MELLVVLVLVLLLIGALPTWGYSRNWTYGPSSLVGLIVLIFILWILFGGAGRLHI